MKLTKITVRNFKGRSGSLDLAQINFLVGQNFIGKTTWADAIRLLLIGYLPELGKTNAATFGLASGREMEVSAEFSDGTKANRVWRLKGDSVASSGDFVALEKDGTNRLFSVMLDASTYFELSDRDRVAYVFANFPLTDAPEFPESVNAVLAAWHDKMPADLSPQQTVDHALNRCIEITKTAKANADQMQKTAQGLAYLRTQDEPAKGLDALDRERETITAEIETQQATKARHIAQYEAALASRRRRQTLQGEIRGKDALMALLTPLRNKIEGLRMQESTMAITTQEEVDAIALRAREAQFALRDLDRQVQEVTASITKNDTEKSGIEAKSSCPYCGATGDGWKTLKTAEIDSALAGLRVKFTQLTDHRELVQADVSQLNESAAKALEALRQRNAILRQIADAKRETEGLDKQFTSIELKEGELANIPAEDPEAQVAVEMAQTALNVANDALRNVDTLRKAAMGRASELKRLAEAETARDKAKVDETQAKAAVDALRTIQGKMVEAAFGPLIEQANSFFPEILRTPLAYNPERGAIGTWRDGVWVGHHTFSGVEKLVCFAAIQMALAARSPFKIMILDEMLRAQNTTKLAAFDILVMGCKHAVESGKIDQFVGLIPGNPEDYANLADSSSLVIAIR